MTRLIPVHSDILVTFFTSSDCCNDFDTFVKGLPCNPHFSCFVFFFFFCWEWLRLWRAVSLRLLLFIYMMRICLYNPNCSFLLFFFLFSFLLGMAASLARRVLAVTFVYLYAEDRSYNPNVYFLFLFVVFC